MRKIKRVLICILGFVILSVSCITANATSEIRSILGNENTDSNVDRMIEMKDILDVTLYRKQTDPTSGEVKYSEVSDIEHIYIKYYSNQFLARVQMKDLPDFYAPVKGCRIENNKCYLEIEYENVTQYTNDGQQQNKLEVLYGMWTAIMQGAILSQV